MNRELEINRNSAIPSSTLPEVVLAAEEYDYGLNLISTMAATRENIVETGNVMNNLLSNVSSMGNKGSDLRDVSRISRSSSVANSPGSVNEEVSGRINDSEGVSFIDEPILDNTISANSTNSGTDEQNVPINVSPIVEEESFAVEDTDTDDDVILVVQPIETIELLGDDDDTDVQIVNSDEPIPKPKRLPQNQLKQQQQQPHQYGTSSSSTSTSNNNNNTFPLETPRLPEPMGMGMFSEDEHLAPILKDLLDDHFGQLDFEMPLGVNMTEQTEVVTHNRPSYGKSPRSLFVSQLTTEMAIQTDSDYKPEKKDMETQTDFSTFCGKRKLWYLDNDIDGDECPICYEPWEESGEHSLVSLKCGHLFGDSCLKKWLNDTHTQQKQRLCPVCRTKVEMKHIRNLYARRVIQVNADPEVKRLKQELEMSKERAKKYETLYKREKEREKMFRSIQTPTGHRGHPSTSNGNLQPLIAPQPLLRQPPPTNPQPGNNVPNHDQIMRTLSQIVSPLNVPTTSRGHTANAPPYAIYPSTMVTTRIHRSNPIILSSYMSDVQMVRYDDLPHDYSTAYPISSANAIVAQRSTNH